MMKDKNSQIQLTPEKDYIHSKAGIVENIIQENIDNVKILKETDYSRFIMNVLKNQKRFVQRRIKNEDSKKMLKNVNGRFEKLTKLYELHKNKDGEFFEDVVERYKKMVRDNILSNKDPSDRIENVIKWFKDNFKYGFSESSIKGKMTMEVMKNIYDDKEQVNDLKQKLLKS